MMNDAQVMPQCTIEGKIRRFFCILVPIEKSAPVTIRRFNYRCVMNLRRLRRHGIYCPWADGFDSR